jgi:sodium/hydrogen antiporter
MGLARREAIMEPLTWYFLAGIVLCGMAIGATLICRFRLRCFTCRSGGTRTARLDSLRIHIVNDATFVEQITKAMILIWLFSAGLKMRLPHISQMWLLSLRLAFLSMLITVGLIALIIPG